MSDPIIINQSTHYEAHLYGALEEFRDVRDTVSLLNEMGEQDAVTLKINSPGGSVDVGVTLLEAMARCKGQVVCHVIHPSYSMGAIIALAGDYLLMDPFCFLMFHNYSSGVFGKGAELMAGARHGDAYIKNLFTGFCTPFLTKSEMTKLWQDQDIYIYETDTDYQKRLKRHFKIEVQNEQK